MEENMRITRERNKKTALEQIQAGIKENFRPSKPVKTLSECNTYQDWRENTNRWTLMCGGAHPCQLFLELLEQFQKKSDDSRAKMLLGEIWNDVLESGIPINSISMETFLEQFDKKMVLSRTQEIEMLERTWFYFHQNTSKDEWASETVTRLKKLTKDLASLGRIKEWGRSLKN